jgi:hypothetical protein
MKTLETSKNFDGSIWHRSAVKLSFRWKHGSQAGPCWHGLAPFGPGALRGCFKNPEARLVEDDTAVVHYSNTLLVPTECRASLRNLRTVNDHTNENQNVV